LLSGAIGSSPKLFCNGVTPAILTNSAAHREDREHTLMFGKALLIILIGVL